MKKLLAALSNVFKKLLGFVSSPEFNQYEATALGIVQTISAIAPAPVRGTLNSVIAVYSHYGLPITSVMKDGVVTPDEAKALIGLAAAKVFTREFPHLSTTQANVMLNAAYLESK